ncbi:MAG: ABC transporter permease [Thermanaerothrix sp.]|uniref:ABC transporter permease n=1 Tax=Thermanaerothrix solaris TaxID=3058434 RepID=A0ABU3NNU7_9CHLR|nr:ABC transporter permease [Thermanaerothrix sp. 4228-RoL]MDT8898524.1 ABC transporter permease [Thermanaerothrix sp. 4228-RoL]
MTTAPADTTFQIQEPLWKIRLRIAWKGFKQSWMLFTENKIGLVGLGIILFFGLMAVAHPILMHTVWEPNIYDPFIGNDPTILQHPSPPSARHLLGTDPVGRDVLSQLMYSTQSEFILGLLAAIVTVTIATSVGAISAYFGGALDAFFMRLADLINILPFIALLVVLTAFFDFGMIELALLIGILSGFGGTTIIFKAQALTIKVKPYIEAAKVAGGSDLHIIFRHIVPNLMPLAFLNMMFTVTGAIFSEAALSFFGLLNLRMSWGIMINTTQAAGYLLGGWKYWYLIVPPGLAITLLCSAFYLVGRALDEVVNPRLRRR